MLILSRRVGETVLIGDVKVTVCEIRNQFIKLGVEAPREMLILREELVDDEDEQQAA